MAKLNISVLGIFSGKLGNMVGYNLNGKQIVRSLPRKSAKAPTLKQLEHRMRFSLVAHFLSPLRPIIRTGYGNRKGGIAPLAQSIRCHIRNAITGTYPNLGIDYSKVVLSTGFLLGCCSFEISSTYPALIDFRWIEMEAMANPSDHAVLVTYCPAMDRHHFLISTSTRIDGMAMLKVPSEFSGQTVHCWIAFMAQNGKDFSYSNYLGSLTVA